MSRNTSVTLGDHFARFVDAEIGSGRYASASEVVRAGLRLLEEHEMRLQTLREALISGENSGAAAALDFDALIAHKHGTRSA